MSTIFVRSLYVRCLDDDFVLKSTITRRQHKLGRAALLEEKCQYLEIYVITNQTYCDSRAALSDTYAKANTG